MNTTNITTDIANALIDIFVPEINGPLMGTMKETESFRRFVRKFRKMDEVQAGDHIDAIFAKYYKLCAGGSDLQKLSAACGDSRQIVAKL